MKGYTLLELLLVVSILAIVAGGTLLAFDGTEEQAEQSVLRCELATLRKATLAFRRDTGYLPKTGPFAFSTAVIPTWLPSDVDAEDWFDSPANLYQLLASRDAEWVVAVMEAEGTYGPRTGRGYFGPYLERCGERFVYVGAGDPCTGDADFLVPGVTDCYRVPRPVVARRFLWQDGPSKRSDATDLDGLLNLGRPFLYLPAGAFGDGLGPRILSMGPDGDAGFTSSDARADNVVVFLQELP